MWYQKTIGTWVLAERMCFAFNDNNGEARHQNVTRIQLDHHHNQGDSQNKTKATYTSTHIMEWNKVHRGYARFL